MKAAATLDALERRVVEELLVTSRFIDVNREDAARALSLAEVSATRITIVGGTAAFELDLVADGVDAAADHGKLAT